MFYLLGAFLANYLIYLILALIFKHEIGFWIFAAITNIPGFIILTLNPSYFFSLIISMLSSILIYFVESMQIRNGKSKNINKNRCIIECDYTETDYSADNSSIENPKANSSANANEIDNE